MAVLPFRLGSRRIASRSVAAIVPALGLLAGQGCMPPGEQAGSGPGHRQSFLMILAGILLIIGGCARQFGF